MELHADKPGMIHQLYDFDQAGFGIGACLVQVAVKQLVRIFGIKLIAMTMALVNDRRTIGRHAFAVFLQLAGILAQPLCTAQMRNTDLCFHHIDDRVGSMGIHFRGIGPFQPCYMACIFDNGHL